MSTPQSVAVNWQKFLILLASLAMMGMLVVFGRAEWADVSAPFGLVVGYATANGIGAAKGEGVNPLFRPTNPTRRADDLSPPALPAAPSLPPRDPFAETE